MEKQTSDVSTDFWLHVTIKNTSDDAQYVWGQRGFYIVEAFIKNPDSQVWERQNVVICGTSGDPDWHMVESGQEIKLVRREAVDDIGKSMILTFNCVPTPVKLHRGAETLLGPFKIPEVTVQ